MIRLVLLVLAALLGAFTLAAADEVPKAEAVLDRYLEVTGGKAAYEKVHSEVTKGTMEVAGRGIKGALQSFQAEPYLEYTVVDLEGIGKVESGSDGDVFWERSAVTPARMPSKTSMGSPPGYASVFSMIGGTAPINTAFATRDVPWRPIYRATSPPPVEWPTSVASLRSSFSIRVARSSAYVSISLPFQGWLDRP